MAFNSQKIFLMSLVNKCQGLITQFANLVSLGTDGRVRNESKQTETVFHVYSEGYHKPSY